jgi:hypothetical protein
LSVRANTELTYVPTQDSPNSNWQKSSTGNGSRVIRLDQWQLGNWINSTSAPTALQELGLDVGDSLYLIEEFVGNTRGLILSKKPEIADRIDELTEA